MHEYDFTNLNPNEFEILANDLLSNLYGLHIERFKPGKDLGIDGRFFCLENSPAAIIQCKHYASSGFTKLLYELINTELPKIKNLSPEKYLVVASVPLSPQEKERLKNGMAPFIVNTSDIFGKEDINALLRQFPDVEKAHYKLWIASSAVLSQFLNAKIHNVSQSIIADAYDKCTNYVITSSHSQAKEKINATNVLVITGDPGVGKTTLAEQLCLEFVADGYEFFAITKDIEDGFAVLTRDSKQIFYFDDFLGKNYIETLRFNEDSRIMQFINSVARSGHKKFILTSRTNILDQGYRVGPSFANGKIKNKEYLIDVSEYTHTDKAKILYSFLWRSDLGRDFLEQIIAGRKYVNIIYHRNYNPRLLEFITSSEHVDLSKHNSYPEFIENALKNPTSIWEHPYSAQLDDASRAVVDLITFGNGNVTDASLRKAYNNFQNSGLHNNKTHLANDFDSTMSILSRSFIKRTCTLDAVPQPSKTKSKDKIRFSPFNPSISDYVLSRYSRDYRHIADMILLYEGDEGIAFLENALLHNKELVRNVAKIICDRKKDDDCFCNSINYLRMGVLLEQEDFNTLFKGYSTSQARECISGISSITDNLLNFCYALLSLHSSSCTEREIAELILTILDCDMGYYEIINMSSLINSFMPQDFHDEIVKKYYEKVIEHWKYERLEEFASDHVDEFASEHRTEYEDGYDSWYNIDEDKLANLIAEDTSELYTPIKSSDIKALIDFIDLESIVSNYYQSWPDDDRRAGSYSSGEQDIDGIFEGFISAKFE